MLVFSIILTLNLNMRYVKKQYYSHADINITILQVLYSLFSHIMIDTKQNYNYA